MIQKLEKIIDKHNSFVCVGLDSDIEKIPSHLKYEQYPQFAFNKAIIDSTYEYACAFKPNTAFYEARGEEGIRELKMTMDYINEKYSDIVTILDAKRADIGNTNAGYVHFAYEYLKADSITLHPYLGREALMPFLEKKEKGAIILCKTSNPGSGEFQNLVVDGEPLYQRVARTVSHDWNMNDNCLLVVGATYPEEIAAVREVVGDMTLLIPGVGAQGGDVEKTVQVARNSKGKGMIINSSRGIIFASGEKDFATAAANEAKKLRAIINACITAE